MTVFEPPLVVGLLESVLLPMPVLLPIPVLVPLPVALVPVPPLGVPEFMPEPEPVEVLPVVPAVPLPPAPVVVSVLRGVPLFMLDALERLLLWE